MPTFDDAWLQEYLRTHPVEARRMPRVLQDGNAPRSREDAPGATIAPRGDSQGAAEPEEPEGVFMGRLRTLAVDDLKLLWYHTYSSKRSAPGFPDVAMVRPAEDLQPDEPSVLYLVELKGTNGVVSPAQRRWLEALRRVTSVHAQAAWPQDYGLLERLLVRRTS